jgi:hypothetical protein
MSSFGDVLSCTIGGFSRSCFVNSTDSELISVAFFESRHLCVSSRTVCGENFVPRSREFFFFLDHVSCNRSASVALRRSPFKIDAISVPVGNFWSAWFAWNIERILCNYRLICFQRFRFALIVDSSDSEVVFVSFYQSFHVHFCVVCASDGSPATCLFV